MTLSGRFGGRNSPSVHSKAERVHDPARAAQALRLPARARIGQLDAVEDVAVLVPLAGVDGGLEDAEAGRLERVLLAVDAQLDRVRVRRPDAELRAAVAQREGAQPALEGELVHVRQILADVPRLARCAVC